MNIQEELGKALHISIRSRAILDDPHWQTIYKELSNRLYLLWMQTGTEAERNEIWHVQKALNLLQGILEDTSFDSNLHPEEGKGIN